MGQIRFMKHYITDGEHKARVFYSAYRMTTTKQLCVALYAKDYTNDLHKLFPADYENRTDIQSDYFEKGTVRILEGDPLYEAALARAKTR